MKKYEFDTALLSDVTYGMPKKMMLEDLGELASTLDIICSSCEVGFRKPSLIGFECIANHFDCNIEHVVYVGNEEKDINCANSAGAKFVLFAPCVKRFG